MQGGKWYRLNHINDKHLKKQQIIQTKKHKLRRLKETTKKQSQYTERKKKHMM